MILPNDVTSVEEGWKSFEATFVPTDASATYRNAMRQAFYAGAGASVIAYPNDLRAAAKEVATFFSSALGGGGAL